MIQSADSGRHSGRGRGRRRAGVDADESGQTGDLDVFAGSLTLPLAVIRIGLKFSVEIR